MVVGSGTPFRLSSIFSVTTQVCFVVYPGALRNLCLVNGTERHQPFSRYESLVIHFDPRGSNGTKGAPYLLGSKVRRFFLVVLPCVTSCSFLATGQMAALIPVVFMLVVKVAIVYVVDVVTVGDGNVPATRTVLVRVILVNDVLSSHSAQPSCAFIDATDTLRELLNSDLNDIHNIWKIAGKRITGSLIEN